MNEWTPANNLHIPQTDFERNDSMDLRPYLKQIKGLDYIPWGVSKHLLRKYNDKLEVGYETQNGLPYTVTPFGLYITAYVYDTASGKRTPGLIFPVRVDRQRGEDEASFTNRHTTAVNMSTIGNDLQRAYAKAVAFFTGIGWSLYSRVDESITDTPTTEVVPTKARVSKPIVDDVLDF